MLSLNNQQFENLLKGALIENFCSDLLLTNDEEEEFYFYYDPSEGTITDQGEIELSGEQKEKLIAAFADFPEEDSSEDAFSNITDPYTEYGVDRAMFL